MPPIGTLQIDSAGLQLLIAWLQSLSPVPGR
jgi:ABC-type transporter Mla MlaB component